MLPRTLYELLPCLYLATGIFGGLIIDSSLIMIGSMLLISTGLLTIYMRYQYRSARYQVRFAADSDRRSGHDRRQQAADGFPLSDHRGRAITAERRLGDRRED